jgi:hypothetical protein
VAIRQNEKELDRVLGLALRTDDEFLLWFIGHTRFAGRYSRRILIRDDYAWGAPLGGQSKFRETDILLVCEDASNVRFAIHVENKGPKRGFDPGQARDYPLRAEAWARVDKWGGYSEWECVLVAPASHLSSYPEECAFFDTHISYEAIEGRLGNFS